MNNKRYVGRRISRFEAYGQSRSIDGIALVVDEDTEYRAGDQDGYVLEVTCPYGSQAMANRLLAELRGKSFDGYMAQDAVMDPAAELGDGVTVNGIYAPLASRRVVFGSGRFGEISAPGERDLDHEYGTGDPIFREIERKLASTRSYIEKTSGEIRLGIESEMDGRFSQLGVTVDAIAARVEGARGDISALTQTADKINWVVKSGTGEADFTMTDRAIRLVADAIDLEGMVTFSDLSTAGRTRILGDNIITGKIQSANGKVYFDLDNNELACSVLKSAKSYAIWPSYYEPGDVIVDISKQRKVEGGNWYSMARFFKDGYETGGVNIMPAKSGEGSYYIPTAETRIFTTDVDLHLGSHTTEYGFEGTAQLQLNDRLAWLYSLTADMRRFIGVRCDADEEIVTITGPEEIYLEGAVRLWYLKIQTDSSARSIGVTSGGRFVLMGSSSRRYKHDIGPVTEALLDPERLYDIPVRQFTFNEDYLSGEDERQGMPVIGLIAEDVERAYPVAVIHDDDGNVENWQERYIVPAMLALIQQHKREIDQLKKRMEEAV